MRASSPIKVYLLQGCCDGIFIPGLPFFFEPVGHVEILPPSMILDHAIDTGLCGPQ